MITRTLLRPSHPHRRLTARLAWLMVAAVAVWALFGGAAFVGATHVTPTEREGNPTCAQLVQTDGEFRLDAKDFAGDGTYGDGVFSVDLTFTYNEEVPPEVVSFDFTDADPDVIAVFVKGGDTGYLYQYAPPADADTGLVAPPGPQGQAAGISHISFCYLIPVPTETPTVPPTETPTVPPTETPTAPPTETPTVPPTETPTVPPTETPTATPTGTEAVGTPTPTPVVTPTPTPVVTPTPTPSETVGGETPTPTPVVTPTATPSETVGGATPTAVITPPATSTETPASSPTQSGLLLVLLLLGMGTTGLLVFSPRRFRSR
jgi:hypothetical protein